MTEKILENVPNIYLGLVHHPIRNKRGEEVTTSVTNLDIHDIARSCETYGIKSYFIVTPLEAQHQLVNKILGHWKEDRASVYNPDRQQALDRVVLSPSIEEAIAKIEEVEGKKPLLAVTGANFTEYQGDTEELKKKACVDSTPVFLLFGTGWGLHEKVTDQADFKLVPLRSNTEYNHLSVRSAVAIYLDRLFGI
jgi:hypothetical protein